MFFLNNKEVPGKLLGAIFNGLTLNVEGIEDTTACSHISAITYYTESITDTSCKFTAYPCKSEADFKSGKCLKCSSPNGCNRMGYYSSPDSDLGSLYLNTQNLNNKRLCLQYYIVKLYSNNLNNIKQTRGKFTIYFKTTSQETSSTKTIDDSETTFKQDSIDIRLISLKENLNSTIKSAIISFEKKTNFFSSWIYNSKRSLNSWLDFFDDTNYDDRWSFRLIEIYDGEKQILVELCPKYSIIMSSKSVEFAVSACF